MTAGEVEALDRVHLVNAGSVPVRRGFRYAQDVQAFQRVAHGELIGYVSGIHAPPTLPPTYPPHTYDLFPTALLNMIA